jgi:hypothetical protein
LSAWNPQQVWDTGFIGNYSSNLAAVTVERFVVDYSSCAIHLTRFLYYRYPASNCNAKYGVGAPVDVQALLATMMQHKSATDYVAPYCDSAALAVAAGKPFVVLEWNTAACSGFAGLSDAFGAALWALDTGLQMASANFSGAMLHMGGQNTYYNVRVFLIC